MFLIFKRTSHLQELLDIAAEARKTAELRAECAEEKLKKRTRFCSFCDKTEHDVKKLFVGRGTAICGECVSHCVKVILCEETAQ